MSGAENQTYSYYHKSLKMIKITELTKVYRTEEVETLALNRLSLEINQGEFVSIMGPSGCGKSSLLNIIGLMSMPTSGKYWFLNEEVSRYSERKRSGLRKRHIGFVFQSFNLIEELTVFENIELPMLYTKVPATERKARVESLLERLDIQHREKHYPRQLSGGQQQRVAVARAVANEPKLILADEPTGNLDSSSGDSVMEILKDLNENGTTVVMVTHSPYCAGFGDRTIQLFDGKMVLKEPHTELVQLEA